MWISGEKFAKGVREIFEEKGAVYLDSNFRRFTSYKLNDLIITVPNTHAFSFTVFIESAEKDYNFHQPRNCSVDFAINKFKKHIESLKI